MYVRLSQIACIYIVTERVENSYSSRGLVQAKVYSSPGILRGRALSSIPDNSSDENPNSQFHVNTVLTVFTVVFKGIHHTAYL